MKLRNVFLRILICSAVLLTSFFGLAQVTAGTQLAELISLKDKVRDPDTRTRVSAFHRVWRIALGSDSAEVKLTALDLMSEPVASASDHIRMPAVYAIVDVANSSSDPQVKRKAIAMLHEPMIAAQVPIRDAAVDAVNLIIADTKSSEVAMDAVNLLGEAVRSGNNGVRIPAINAVVFAVRSSQYDKQVADAAIQVLNAPLESDAMIGGMEVRLMAVTAIERIGVGVSEVGTKAKAMGMLMAYAAKDGWEPEARKLSGESASRIQATMR